MQNTKNQLQDSLGEFMDLQPADYIFTMDHPPLLEDFSFTYFARFPRISGAIETYTLYVNILSSYKTRRYSSV